MKNCKKSSKNAKKCQKLPKNPPKWAKNTGLRPPPKNGQNRPPWDPPDPPLFRNLSSSLMGKKSTREPNDPILSERPKPIFRPQNYKIFTFLPVFSKPT